MEKIQQNRTEINQRVAAACRRVNRSPDTVRIVAVSKTHNPAAVSAAFEAGITVFGENRVQEARAKIPLVSNAAVWHLVGHLQTNKARVAAGLFGLIHSVDSVKLLASLDKAAREAGRVLSVLLEVNLAAESAKFGFPPENLADVLKESICFKQLEILGLMCIPPIAPEAEHSRPYFRRLRELRDAARDATGYDLPELSMGMSQDFEIAVEEGATWLRLGTALFGKRESVWRR